MEKFELIESTKGKPSALLSGYQYRQFRQNKDNIITWLCMKEKKENCKGRMKSKEGFVLLVSEHSCKPDIAASEVKKQCSVARKRAREEDLSLSEIYRQEFVPLFSRGLHFMTEVPLYSSQKSSLYRIRQKSQGVPKEPLSALDIEIPGHIVEMKDGEHLIAIDENIDDSRIIVPSSKKGKNSIATSSTSTIIGFVMDEKLTYVQLSSMVNPSFWNKLTELKLNVDKLDETERHIWGYYPLLSNNSIPYPLLEVDSTSFNEEFNGQNTYIPFEGKIANKNTIEQFKECNKMELLNTEGANLYKKIVSGEALERPSVLNTFLILSFADLKKYHYYYWFAFPVPNSVILEKVATTKINNTFSEDMRQKLYNDFRSLNDVQKPYFIVDTNNKEVSVNALKNISTLTLEAMKDIYFAFFNISNKEDLIGSQLRNYVALLIHHCPFLQGTNQKFIALQCKRDSSSQISIDNSVIYSLTLPNIAEGSMSTWVAWEKNERDKMGPRMANMKNTLDPRVLAENAVDLNLKLMKWRVVSDIDLEKVKQTKCLLLGSGTLGCSVARCLLAWGVRDITFVDNSTVSFSNPVRQSLFTYEDSVKMRSKSEAAADRLKEIFPGVKSKGVQLNIPMPGHSVGESMLEQTAKSVDTLTDLIKETDVIFLLMDSRESRWLPTMLGSFYNKIVINAALGFDSYLIMRHGCKSDTVPDDPNISQVNGYKVIQGHNLGCYFCNDVTAPGDSMKNRTLDQQCTVTRPGVSQIAGALAVELTVSMLQHKEGLNAPAFYKVSTSSEELKPDTQNQCLLGLVPHSIRGFLSSFEHILPATLKYDKCVACSNLVLEEYQNNGMEFLLKVFNSSKYLEDVTKLTDMFNEIDLDEVLELSDELSD